MFRYSLTSLCEGFNKCLKLKCGPTPFVINSKSINTSSVMKNDGDDETFNYAAPKRVVARGHSDADRLRTLGPKQRRILEAEQGFDASSTIQALQNELDVKPKFQRFPDETTEEKLFNDVPFTQLPIVSIRITKNNTRFWVTTADGKLIFYTSPKKNGFQNKKKSTSVAAQFTANAVGQKLRLLNMRTIRIRIEGFSEGRIASVKGLVQAGSTVVAIQDITTVDWDWSQRAKKRRRVN